MDTMNEDLDEKLIYRVQQFPCLYVHSRHDFKDQGKKENAWKAIGEAVSRDGKHRSNIGGLYLKISPYSTTLRKLDSDNYSTIGICLLGVCYCLDSVNFHVIITFN